MNKIKISSHKIYHRTLGGFEFCDYVSFKGKKPRSRVAKRFSKAVRRELKKIII